MCVFSRFGHLFNDSAYLLAALTHPSFKTHWIDDAKECEEATFKLKNLVKDATTPVNERSLTSLTDDFLFFNTKELSKPDEVDFYLRDPETSIEMLDKYPQIKQLFVKYNTTIPTSAPVERLFSTAALILTVRRNRLSDSLLEMLILLKIALKL